MIFQSIDPKWLTPEKKKAISLWECVYKSWNSFSETEKGSLKGIRIAVQKKRLIGSRNLHTFLIDGGARLKGGRPEQQKIEIDLEAGSIEVEEAMQRAVRKRLG